MVKIDSLQVGVPPSVEKFWHKIVSKDLTNTDDHV